MYLLDVVFIFLMSFLPYSDIISYRFQCICMPMDTPASPRNPWWCWVIRTCIRLTFMMTSPNGNIFHLCAGNSPVTSEFPAQRPVTRSFDAFFDLRLSKRLGKQSWGWWSEMLSRPLWRHCNVITLWINVTASLCKCAFFVWRHVTSFVYQITECRIKKEYMYW